MLGFRFAGLYKYILGTTKRPLSEGEEQEKQDDQDMYTLVMLVSAVYGDYTLLIMNCDTAATAQKFLTNRYD